MEKKVFVLADDFEIIQKGLSFYIKSIYNESDLYFAKNLKDIIEYVKQNKTDYLILDLNFRNKQSLDLISILKIINPNLKVLIFSDCDKTHLIVKYLREGCDGYLSKNIQEKKIKSALEEFILTGKYICNETKENIFEFYMYNLKKNPLDKLSNKEYEVSCLLRKGKHISEIAEILKLNRSTISTYKSRIFKKLEIKNMKELLDLFSTFDI